MLKSSLISNTRESADEELTNPQGPTPADLTVGLTNVLEFESRGVEIVLILRYNERSGPRGLIQIILSCNTSNSRYLQTPIAIEADSNM